MTTLSPPPASDRMQTTVDALGIPCIDRHIFICADQTKPKCCSKEDSITAWNYLKTRLKELGLDKPSPASNTVTSADTTDTPTPHIFRTKANCLRVCMNGPILVVYPDGIWYRNATPDVIERIIQEHLLGDRPVTEYIIANHPLPDQTASPSAP